MCSSSPVYSPGERTSTSGLPARAVLEHFVAEGANRQIGILGRDIAVAGYCGSGSRDHARPSSFPALAAAVHDQALVVAVELEHPEGVAGPPVVLVAVEHDGRVVGDALGRAQARRTAPCRCSRARVASCRSVCQSILTAPGTCPCVIQQHVFVRFDDANVGIAADARRPSAVVTSTSG